MLNRHIHTIAALLAIQVGIITLFAEYTMTYGKKVYDVGLHLTIYLLGLKYEIVFMIQFKSMTNSSIEKENKTNQVVLFPIRIDDSIMKSNKAWAMKIKQSRNIGDFINWGDEKLYNRSFDRLLVNLNQQ